MKKIFSILMIMLMTIGVSFAQDNEKLYFNNVLNNRFGDNWELSLGGGAVYSAWDKWGFDQNEFFDNVGWTAEVSATKWFNPVVGGRVQVAGGQLNVWDGVATSDSWFVTPHADVVVNLSNWISGYREDRVYYAKVFAGAGMHVVDMGDDAGYGAVGTAGLINTFRVSPRFDINLELKGYVMRGDDMQRVVVDNDRVGQLYDVTVGLAYRFGKRDWDRGVKATDAAAYLATIAALTRDLDNERDHTRKLTDRLRKYDDALKALAKENKALHDQIKNHKCEANVVTTSTVFFEFDSYKLCDRSKVSLDLLADVIKNSPEKQVFTIEGSADSKTGSADYNKKLSEKRAKAVYDYLISVGVAKEKLTYVGVGGTDRFKVTNTNRVAIIK